MVFALQLMGWFGGCETILISVITWKKKGALHEGQKKLSFVATIAFLALRFASLFSAVLSYWSA